MYYLRIYLSIRAGNSQFSVCFARKRLNRDTLKTNRDFETAILHYIDGVGGKYIFFRLVVNLRQNCRLKIAISL